MFLSRLNITLKQLETIYWIANLGTFERAAIKLNTTQSAVSKRIQELEVAVGAPLFDRSLRGARLTEKGEYLIAVAAEMLNLQARVEAIRDGGADTVTRIRFGVTELAAMTWLPRLVALLRASYPNAKLEPQVDMGRNLYDRLMDSQLDLIVIPETFSAPEVTSELLGHVRNEWMARPGLVWLPPDGVLSLARLVDYPILAQGSMSGSGLYFAKWMRSEGIAFDRLISSDSMTALLGLTIAGFGVSYMPTECFQALIDEGKLEVVPTDPPLPPVPYAAMYRNDRPFAIATAVAKLAAQACDFTRQFQG